MSRKDNLIPQAHKFTLEEQSLGGKISAAKRKEAKAIQNILTSYLNSDVKGKTALEKLAKKADIEDAQSVKEIYVVACLLNSLKDGDLRTLKLLSELLGETTEAADSAAEKQEAFLIAIKKAVLDNGDK